ncbi:protein MOR1-like [Olea europaea var. sylvestris]|uniref:protein MOR1-like n=1 Tax=Olea europaea var. sylvestris TaxID=158386 RepID=UPI000C1D7D95|nr:protein MOR1-like [Olea europaea var. sylvestris]
MISFWSLQLITDVNIAVAVEAIQATGNLASGLRTHFSGNSRFLLPVLLEKLKEKKPTLTEALTQTLQAMHKRGCLNLADIVEGGFLFSDISLYHVHASALWFSLPFSLFLWRRSLTFRKFIIFTYFLFSFW